MTAKDKKLLQYAKALKKYCSKNFSCIGVCIFVSADDLNCKLHAPESWNLDKLKGNK
jgi:hypothetical protein